MQPHIKNYLAQTNKLPHEIACELCSRLASDIHHIEHRQKNNPKLDKAENLIALCRDCHTWIHKNNTQENKQHLKEKAILRCRRYVSD